MNEKKFGGIIIPKQMELKDLLDDDSDQIMMSDTLFEAFDYSSKKKKNYNKRKSYKLFKYVVCMYNDTFADDKYGALSFLERVVDSLDYLKPETLMELSLSKLNVILDNSDAKIEEEYEKIKNSRKIISKKDFRTYIIFLQNNHNTTNAKNMFSYVKQLYNENAIIQDNISVKEYLRKMAMIKSNKLFSMRLYEILELLSINDINFESVNEEKMLINDIESE